MLCHLNRWFQEKVNSHALSLCLSTSHARTHARTRAHAHTHTHTHTHTRQARERQKTETERQRGHPPSNFPLLMSEPEEQAEIWVFSTVRTNAAPGSLSTIRLVEGPWPCKCHIKYTCLWLLTSYLKTKATVTKSKMSKHWWDLKIPWSFDVTLFFKTKNQD